jgi:hypothetical protein
MKQILIAISLMLLLTACRHKSGREDALAAHHTAEKVKEAWTQQTKPLEIHIVDRTREELEAIGSIGVWLCTDKEETATEFRFDGESFKPFSPVKVDSTARPGVMYPFRVNAHRGDTLRLTHPMGPQMIGKIQSIDNQNEKITVNIDLKDITSLLRVRLKSDRIEDVLDDIALQGVSTLQSATYDTPLGVLRMDVSHGTLSHLVNCMLNNGMAHDFHLIPVEEPCEATLTVTVNGTPHRVTTLLPPLREGSITELYLMLHQGKLTVGSSWVDTKFAFSPIRTYRNDSIRVGDFLQKDGSCSAFCNEESIALVIESNGRHGKAVALKDNDKVNLAGKNRFCTGRLFETVDGKCKEGSYKPKATSKANDEETVRFMPGVNYHKSTAFSVMTGADLFQKMFERWSEADKQAYEEAREYGTAYLPSLYEMARLSIELHKLPEAFQQPEGFYATCCESGADTYYAIDPRQYLISAYNSKAYPTTKVRLFYLF